LVKQKQISAKKDEVLAKKDEQLATAVRLLRKAGFKSVEIAKEVNLPKATVLRIIKS
jgi:DNA invertase Pin-like site-specific DNA recombinase